MQSVCELRMFVLAQLVAPPIQSGPVRLPENKAFERQEESDSILIEIPKASPIEKRPVTKDSPPPVSMEPWIPVVQGKTPYTESELKTILRPCSGDPSPDTLRACAASLTAKLTADGFVNSRVFTLASPAPGQLKVVEGRLVEIRVTSDDVNLQERVSEQLKPLLGNVLHLPTLQQALVELKNGAGIGQIQGNMSRLGSDPTQAILRISVDPKPTEPWTGELTLRNDGNGGTGQARAQAVLLKKDLITADDSLLLYQELNADHDPELGSTISSISYTWPFAKDWTFTGSFGHSRRQLVEASGISHELSFRQFQGLGQVETVLHQSKNQRWSAFAGVSANRNDSYLRGQSIPLVLGGGEDGWLKSGYVRAGINGTGRYGRLFWSQNLYGLQGIASFTKNRHLKNLAFYDISPGEARAVGGYGSLNWLLSPSTAVKLTAGGQWAFNPMPSSMGFSLGGDTGLRGLPGSFISGDSGWIGSTELNWTFWKNDRHSLQLVPFVGVGGVQSTRDNITINDTIGSGGLLARWLAGKHWQIELGWTDQFNADDNAGYWNDWLLGSGVYGSVKYRF